MPLILLKLSILSSLIIHESELWPFFLLKASKSTRFYQKIQKKNGSSKKNFNYYPTTLKKMFLVTNFFIVYIIKNVGCL